jgi:prepilin-type N-terminal cleavage/methylation domain-containing protein
MNKEEKISGFTLVELSIVLIIVGLITGGIIGAQSLINSSKIKKVISDVADIRTAVNGFSLEYDDVPGDFSQAYSYWNTNCGTNNAALSNDGGCNGDGDGLIEIGSAVAYGENLAIWKHLILSELLKGNYTGASSSSAVKIGTNVPVSTIDGGGYEIRNFVITGFNFTNSIRLGAAATNDLAKEALTIKDATNIDKKIDDGVPVSGRIYGANGSGSSSCINTTPNPDAYNLGTAGIHCILYFAL